MAAGEAFSFLSRQRLDQAVAGFEQRTQMAASVFVGSATGNDVTGFADEALAALPAQPHGTVLIVVDPGRRALAVRTDARAARRLSDDSCALATLSMSTSFMAGDLVGGVVVGLRMLGDATQPELTGHGRPEATSSTVTRR